MGIRAGNDGGGSHFPFFFFVFRCLMFRCFLWWFGCLLMIGDDFFLFPRRS